MNDKFEMIKDRIAHILRAKNLTATQFAEMMQIQPSNVSHLLSGRNKPSLDFLIKLKATFPEYSFDWIILGRKPITNSDPMIQHDNGYSDRVKEDKNPNYNLFDNQEIEKIDKLNMTDSDNIDTNTNAKELKQIIYVFDDHTFEIFDKSY